MYQPKTGQACTCKRGQQRDNCPQCEGTGQRIDFQKIRERPLQGQVIDITPTWAGLLPLMLAVMEDGSETGRREIREEFRKMARAADLYNESVKGEKCER